MSQRSCSCEALLYVLYRNRPLSLLSRAIQSNLFPFSFPRALKMNFPQLSFQFLLETPNPPLWGKKNLLLNPVSLFLIWPFLSWLSLCIPSILLGSLEPIPFFSHIHSLVYQPLHSQYSTSLSIPSSYLYFSCHTSYFFMSISFTFNFFPSLLSLPLSVFKNKPRDRSLDMSKVMPMLTPFQ